MRRWHRPGTTPAPPQRRRAGYVSRQSLPWASDLRPAAFWGMAFGVLAGGYSAFAPVADDYRSSLRDMTECQVGYVIDGDTVELRCRGRGPVRARIVGYDAPELFSPGCPAEADAAERSRRGLEASLPRSRRVEVAFLGRDRYDRQLVDMRVEGRRVATRMVEAGHGRRYFGNLRRGWC